MTNDRRPSTTPYDVRDATPPVELTEGTTAGRARAVVVLANVLTSLRRDGVNPRAILAAVPGLAQAIVTELDATAEPPGLTLRPAARRPSELPDSRFP